MISVLTLSKLKKKFFFKGPLWGALFFFSFTVLAQDWQDPQWLKLLRYNPTIFGGYKSEADGQKFFLHPDGKGSPEKELKAFIKAIHGNTDDAYCRFPARFRWLKKHAPNTPVPQVTCEKLDAFRKRTAAKSVSLVFSSYYLNNPASSFGHTFIRLGKNKHSDADNKVTTELLDIGVNYGADTQGAGALWFAIGGLAGFFPGVWSGIPYYYKVREYNDYETRDLWSYELDFTEEEINFIVDQVWEMGHTYFDYYFLTENCSYHMMTVLEGARPGLDLVSHLPYLYVIPADTIRVLDDQNMVQKVKFRPAPSSVFYQELKMLSSSEQKMMLDLYSGKAALKDDLPLDRKALIYDTALSLVDFKYAKDILKGKEEAHAIKRPLLIGRSKIPIRSPELDFSDKMKDAPHKGHRSKRATVGYFNYEGKNKLDLEWRFAYHDLLDYSPAYPYRTRLEVARINYRTDGRDHELREVAALDISSIGKWDQFNYAGTWKVKMGHFQTREKNESLSTQGVVMGYGAGHHFNYFAPYVMGHSEVSYVSERFQKMKLAYGADAGILMDFSPHFKIHSVFEMRAYPWNESNWNNEFRFSTQEFAIGGYQRRYTTDGSDEFGLKFYLYL